MTEIPMIKTHVYDHEKRTYNFTRSIAFFCKKLPYSASNKEYVAQLIRSSGSIGANYIEANESLSKKDFAMRAKICRKEAKESVYWLGLLVDTNSEEFKQEGLFLRDEATELKKIFSSIILKSS